MKFFKFSNFHSIFKRNFWFCKNPFVKKTLTFKLREKKIAKIYRSFDGRVEKKFWKILENSWKFSYSVIIQLAQNFFNIQLFSYYSVSAKFCLFLEFFGKLTFLIFKKTKNQRFWRKKNLSFGFREEKPVKRCGKIREVRKNIFGIFWKINLIFWQLPITTTIISKFNNYEL